MHLIIAMETLRIHQDDNKHRIAYYDSMMQANWDKSNLYTLIKHSGYIEALLDPLKPK